VKIETKKITIHCRKRTTSICQRNLINIKQSTAQYFRLNSQVITLKV